MYYKGHERTIKDISKGHYKGQDKVVKDIYPQYSLEMSFRNNS